MEFNFSSICRICLHEGEMRSIFDDDSDISIKDKIFKCSNIMIRQDGNLPDQICLSCLDDLNVAYRFRSNCESSDAVLQSLIDNIVVCQNDNLILSSESGGEIYKYKPPDELIVKQIKSPNLIKIDPVSDEKFTTNEETEILNSADDESDQEGHFEYSVVEEYNEEKLTDEEECVLELETVNIKTEVEDENLMEEIENVDVVEQPKKNKTRAKRIKASSEKMKILPPKENQDVEVPENGKRIKKTNEKKVKPAIICEICGNLYKYRHALENHMRRHRNEKPFACEICGRAFVINFELRRHMRTHTGQKPYMCRFCGRKFSDYGSRIKHERTHTGERPYVCETCGKAFSYSHVLTSHILTHTGEKKYVCNLCGKRFTKSHHLKAHTNTHLKQQNKQSMLINQVPKSTVTNPELTITTSWVDAAIDEVIQTDIEIKKEENESYFN